MKTKNMFVASLLYIVATIVLVVTPLAVAFGAFDFFEQYSVDGVSVLEFWMIFFFGLLFAFALVASVGLAIAFFKIAKSVSESPD